MAEQALHAEGARLVGHDRHHVAPDPLVPAERHQHAHEGHGGGDLALPRAVELGAEELEVRDLEGRVHLAAGGQVAAEGLASLVQVADLGAVVRRLVEGRLADPVVGDGAAVAIAEGLERLLTHLLRLVREVLALAGLAHAVALDGLGQDHGGLALVMDRGVVGRVDLVRVVAAPVQAPDVLVAHMGHLAGQLGILAEEVLARIGPALGLEGLVLAVDALLHALAQQAGTILFDQRVP